MGIGNQREVKTEGTARPNVQKYETSRVCGGEEGNTFTRSVQTRAQTGRQGGSREESDDLAGADHEDTGVAG